MCAWVHYTMLACQWLWKIMEVNEALQSSPSSPYSGTVIPQGISGRAIETHYCRNHIATEGCKLPGKWMEHTGGRGVRVRVVKVRFSLSTICIDKSLFDFLAGWNMEDDLIKFCLGWILMQSSTLCLWTHLWCLGKFECVKGRKAPLDPLILFIQSICGFQ